MPYSLDYYLYNFTTNTLPLLSGLVSNLLALWLVYLFLRWVLGGKQPTPRDSISRWQGMVPALEEQPDGFYARFAARAKTKLDRPNLPLHKLQFGPSKLHSTRIFPRSLFCVRPLYLKVTFKHFSYYVFAVRAPGGLFLSSWAFSSRTRMENDPYLAQKLNALLRKETLFEYDVAALFSHFMHETLMEVVDEYTTEHKLPPLTAPQRRPIKGSEYAMPADLPSVAFLDRGAFGNSMFGGGIMGGGIAGGESAGVTTLGGAAFGTSMTGLEPLPVSGQNTDNHGTEINGHESNGHAGNGNTRVTPDKSQP